MSDQSKKWCAMCGEWGDHQSGTCPELTIHPTPQGEGEPCSLREPEGEPNSVGNGGGGSGLPWVSVKDKPLGCWNPDGSFTLHAGYDDERLYAVALADGGYEFRYEFMAGYIDDEGGVCLSGSGDIAGYTWEAISYFCEIPDPQHQPTCEWREENPSGPTQHTWYGCKDGWWYMGDDGGTPSVNGWDYCPKCGKKIAEVAFENVGGRQQAEEAE